MVSKSHAPKKASPSAKAPRTKAPATAAAGIKTKAPVKAKASALAARTSKAKAHTTQAQSASAPKTPKITPKEPKAYHFHSPLPSGYGAKLFETKAEQATGERKTKLRVMASLYSGHDYSQAAAENNVPLGNVYLWLADFRRGGLSAL
ncbi:hypothetical protein GOB57_08230 [Sinorhizobium meliloti]|nr:hypothetical protein [Sinorhizobium meliloti]